MGFDKCRDTPQARSRSKSCASALAVIVTIGMAESWGVMQRADVPRHLVAVHHRHLQVHEDEVEMIGNMRTKLVERLPSLRNVVGLPFLRVLSRFYCNRYLRNIN